MVDDLLQNIRRIAVIGSGTMGSQISMACALAGFETTVVDIVDEALEKAEASLRSRMERDVSKGRRQQADVDAAFDRLSFSTDSDQVVSGADVVIEAATENLEIKRKLFAGLIKRRRSTRFWRPTPPRSSRLRLLMPPTGPIRCAISTSSTRRW